MKPGQKLRNTKLQWLTNINLPLHSYNYIHCICPVSKGEAYTRLYQTIKGQLLEHLVSTPNLFSLYFFVSYRVKLHDIFDGLATCSFKFNVASFVLNSSLQCISYEIRQIMTEIYSESVIHQLPLVIAHVSEFLCFNHVVQLVNLYSKLFCFDNYSCRTRSVKSDHVHGSWVLFDLWRLHVN